MIGILQFLYDVASYVVFALITAGAFVVGAAVCVTMPLWFIAPFAILLNLAEPFWKQRQ